MRDSRVASGFSHPRAAVAGRRGLNRFRVPAVDCLRAEAIPESADDTRNWSPNADGERLVRAMLIGDFPCSRAGHDPGASPLEVT